MADPFEHFNDMTRALMANIRRTAYPPLNELTVEQARRAYSASVGVMEMGRAHLPRVEDFLVPGPAGLIRCRLWAPVERHVHSELLPVMLWMHGGGFVVGGIDTCEAMCRSVVAQSGVAVVAVEYRLAPEHKYPAGLEDCFAVLQWLANHGHSLGLNGARMAVGGDSAGGNLAASSALMARDAGIPLALQALFYPSVQSSIQTESFHQFSQGTLLTAELMRWFEINARVKDEPIDWRREPLKADHHGVAPAWIGLAECDALYDEGQMYAQALRQAGVPVEVRVWHGVLHDFINMTRFIPEAKAAHTALAHALCQAFGLSPRSGG